MFVYSLSLLGSLCQLPRSLGGGGGGGGRGVHLHPHETPSSTSNAEPAGPSCTLCVSLLDSGLGTALCPWCLCPLLMHGFHYRGTSPLNGASAPLTIMGPLSPSFTQWSLCWPPQGSLPSHHVSFIHSMGPLPLPLSWDLLPTSVPSSHSLGAPPSLHRGTSVPSSHSLGPPPLSIVGPLSPPVTHWDLLSIVGPLSPPVTHWDLISPSWDLCPLQSLTGTSSFSPSWELCPLQSLTGTSSLSIVGPLSPPVTHWDLISLSIVGPLSPPVTHWDLISLSIVGPLSPPVTHWDLLSLSIVGPLSPPHSLVLSIVGLCPLPSLTWASAPLSTVL